MKVVYGTLTGSANYSKDKHTEYHTNFCSQNTGYQSIEESTHIVRQIASPEIVNAWRDCISGKNKGLACDASQPTKDELRFQITVQNGPHNDLLSANVMTDNLEFVFDQDSTWGGPVNEGDNKLIQFRRIDSSKPALIQIDGTFEESSTSCDYRIPQHDDRFHIDSERMNVWRLVSQDRLPSGVAAASFSSSNCIIEATETLKVNRSTVSQDRSQIAVAYTCDRPDSRHKCGAGQWSPPREHSYSASVNADISISEGVLSVHDIVDSVSPKLAPETGCGKRIIEHIRSLHGTSIDVN